MISLDIKMRTGVVINRLQNVICKGKSQAELKLFCENVGVLQVSAESERYI